MGWNTGGTRGESLSLLLTVFPVPRSSRNGEVLRTWVNINIGLRLKYWPTRTERDGAREHIGRGFGHTLDSHESGIA